MPEYDQTTMLVTVWTLRSMEKMLIVDPHTLPESRQFSLEKSMYLYNDFNWLALDGNTQ